MSNNLLTNYGNSVSEIYTHLKEAKRFSFNGVNFLLIPQSSAVYKVTDNFFGSKAPEILRQIDILTQSGYICSCRKLPSLNINYLRLNIVHACNIICDYCCVDGGYYKGPRKYMDIETARKAVDFLAHRYNGKKPEIRFFGGEPLMNFKAIKECVEYSRTKYPQMEFEFTITTNGLLITDEIAEFFAKYFKEVWVSADGTKEDNDRHRKDFRGRGTWERVVEGVKILERHNVRHVVNAVVTKGSPHTPAGHEKLMRQEFKNAGIASGYDDNLCAEDKTVLKSWFDEIVEKSKKYIERYNTPINRVIVAMLSRSDYNVIDCSFGFEAFGMSPEGDLYLCPDSIMYNDERLHYGHIDNFDSAPDMSKSIGPKCSSCWKLALCGKGCHMKKMVGIRPDDLYCDMEEQFILSALEHISKKKTDELYSQFIPSLYKTVSFSREIITRTCPDITPLFLVPCTSCAMEI